MTSFPTWAYHAAAPARIFNTAEELAAAGDGWVDSPAKVGAQEEPAILVPAEAMPVMVSVPDEVPAAEEAPVPAEQPIVEGDGLDDMDKADLQALCDARGIEYDGRNSRLTLIAKLRGEA